MNKWISCPINQIVATLSSLERGQVMYESKKIFLEEEGTNHPHYHDYCRNSSILSSLLDITHFVNFNSKVLLDFHSFN